MNQQTNKIKYFIYARKSSESEDRQVQSIDDQINKLKEIADTLNLEIKKTYTESKSAKKPDNRPLFSEMLQRIENGEAQGILCWHINRLSRNPIDSGKISWLLQQGIIKSIQTTEKQYLPDDNVILFNVETGSANQFILDLRKYLFTLSVITLKQQAERLLVT
jgi:DNA invertase Pin-like site-specific DNA recombinase